MSCWLYQINQKSWSPERYRYEIWEGQDWAWPVGQKVTRGRVPKAGDTVVFFYAPSGGADAGFYGWAVVLEWFETSSTPMRFRPAAPSDHLKMHPWWDKRAAALADRVRGKVKQGTLWLFQEGAVAELRVGIATWLARGAQANRPTRFGEV